MSGSETSVVKETPVIKILVEQDLESSEDPPMEEWSSLLFELPEENLKRAQYEQNLYDPGSGEICTKYIPLSASSVLRHPYYNYPAVIDPGITKALLRPIPEIVYSDDGQELYLHICSEMGLVPIRSFHSQLIEERVNLSYYGINPASFRAIGKSLKWNRLVKVLDLTDNWINEDGCFHLGEMLSSNVTLIELNLCGCRIGAEGIKRICHFLTANKSLRKLNLSRNQLKDEGVEYLAKAIFKGIHVVDVNLSANDLTGNAILSLAEVFETNNKLTHLYLSRNKILSPNALFTLCQRLAENDNFREIDLSWNALSGTRVGNAIKILCKNPSVRYINLSNNKLSGPDIKSLTGNLKKAKSLITLDLSYNPLSPADALVPLLYLKESTVNLQNLLLENVLVNPEFVDLLNEINLLKCRQNLVVKFGDVRPIFVAKGVDPRDLLLNRADSICKKAKKNKVDIAMVILELHKSIKEPMGQKEFTRALRSCGAMLDDDLIDEMVNVFAGPKTEKTKTINLDKLVDFIYRKWPDRKLPPTPPPEPPPPPKSKKGKKNKK